MESRALIAVVVSVLVLILYQEVVIRHLYPPPPAGETPGEGAPTRVPPPSVPTERLEEIAAAPPPVAEARQVTVENDYFKAVFTSAGGRLESLLLKEYRTAVDADSPLQETVVPSPRGELPLGVELRGANMLSDAGAQYRIDGDDMRIKPGKRGSLEMVWQSEAATIRKRLSFTGDGYAFTAEVSASDFAPEYSELGVRWVKAADSAQAGSEPVFDRTLLLKGRKLLQHPFGDLSDGEIVKPDTGPIAWAGYAGRHFLAAMVPTSSEDHRLWLKLKDDTVEEMVLFPITASAVEQQLTLYVGPKNLDVLEEVGHNLARAVDLGWFAFVAVPMLHGLSLSHRFTGNYGVDIIILTFIIKVLFAPLTQRSFRSMRDMQKLQPQMAKIRERFKDTPEQMNKEIMELYRRHKVNPLGGCLPMVLQIPVFIGLYQSLLNAVELRHAPFMLWINDLSAPDRLGALQLPFVHNPGIPVLTLLMGATMFVQQWMTPSAADPTQQRIMMIMPLMFTFMFVNFPAGLVLYWLVNNLLTIAQQYHINRTSA